MLFFWFVLVGSRSQRIRWRHFTCCMLSLDSADLPSSQGVRSFPGFRQGNNCAINQGETMSAHTRNHKTMPNSIHDTGCSKRLNINAIVPRCFQCAKTHATTLGGGNHQGRAPDDDVCTIALAWHFLEQFSTCSAETCCASASCGHIPERDDNARSFGNVVGT